MLSISVCLTCWHWNKIWYNSWLLRTRICHAKQWPTLQVPSLLSTKFSSCPTHSIHWPHVASSYSCLMFFIPSYLMFSSCPASCFSFTRCPLVLHCGNKNWTGQILTCQHRADPWYCQWQDTSAKSLVPSLYHVASVRFPCFGLTLPAILKRRNIYPRGSTVDVASRLRTDIL